MKKFKKLLIAFAATVLTLSTAFAFTACGGNSGGGEDENVLPTAEEVVQARDAENGRPVKGYDFKLHFGGGVNIAGFNGTANANYVGQYRYNSSDNLTLFKRTTSGALLYDSTEYVEIRNDNKVKMILDGDGTLKRAYAMPTSEQELTLVNLPFEAIFNSLKANNIIEIKAAEKSSGYAYCAQMNFSSSNQFIQKAINLMSKLGTNVKIKNVEFTNVSKIPFYFNLKNGALTDFAYNVDLKFPVKGVNVNFSLDYTQTHSDSQISLPSTSGFVTDEAGITNNLNEIKSLINSVKSSKTYSVDMTAKNEFDPGWNKTATVDSYTTKMYKNTTAEGRADFNQSFKYKTHHEEDGKESYKFAYANLQDETTYLKLFTGKNRVDTAAVTANDRFDYITDPLNVGTDKVACIKKKTSGDTTTFKIYLNKDAVKALQENIVEIINSNNEEGVVDVENYFNTDNTVKDAFIEIVVKSNKIVSAECVTELRYYPVGNAEYEDCNVTLNNTVKVVFNADAEKAAKYEAPKKAEALTGDIQYIL